MNYIIGAGGVGSWLTPSICLLTRPQNVYVLDGDKLEEKNLNRQLFTTDDIGLSKAIALSNRYSCFGDERWFSSGLLPLEFDDWLLVCVDNHPARKEACDACDMRGCKAIFAANETNSAEAYYYDPDWRGTKLDPRVYYPEIMQDRTGDPRAAAIGCTGLVQQANPQLVSANFMAASLLQHLYVLWAMELPKMSREVIPNLPYKLVANMSRLETFKVGDAMKV